MSAVTLASLLVAVAALCVTTVAVLALLRTRRSVDTLQATVHELQAQRRSPPTDLALRPTQLGAAPVVVPTSEDVLRVTMARPLVRTVAFSYGLQRALRPASRDRIRALVRREFDRRRKMRQRAGRRAARMAHVERPS